MKRIFLVILPVLIPACGEYSIRNIDKPAPRSYEGWLKRDGTPLHWMEASKALLECGAPSPDMTSFVYEHVLGISNIDAQISQSFMVSGCMEKAGFVRRWYSLKETCNWHARYAAFPACQPDAVFAERSVERRLNSWYCKLKTDLEYCRKHAFTPMACDDPKKDYNNPPPECQP